MFKFLKGKNEKNDNPASVANEAATVTGDVPAKSSFFNRLQQGLRKTHHALVDSISTALLGKKTIDNDLIEEIETLLLTADVGIDATQELIVDLTERLARKELNDPDAVLRTLKSNMQAIIAPCEKPLTLQPNKPTVILMVGVNGAGKTTTIGKLAKYLQLNGNKVMLAAGDTFRAAAVEQLQVWGERNDVSVIAQHTGADSASVIYDAVQAAKSRHIDVLIADTAGRLHTQYNLMEELKKVVRVTKKLDETAPHEVILVLDATIGQNALLQAEKFHETVKVSGLVITKLDGTAKGGIIFAIAKKLQLPIYFVGIGEGINDLRPFNAKDFVEALFGENGQP